MYGTLKLAALAAVFASASANKLAVGGALDPAHNEHPQTPGATGINPVHVHVTNKVGSPLHAVFVNAAGSPAVGTSQVIHASLSFTIPAHADGQLTLGHNTNAAGSKIEFNNGFQTAATQPYLDVSYVDGFSVPIVCSCGSQTTGCAKPLFKRTRCTSRQPGPVCINTAPDNGPAEPFFAPCRDGAYVISNQAGAGTGTYCASDTITCCVGAACAAGTREVETPGSDVAQRMAEVRGLVDY